MSHRATHRRVENRPRSRREASNCHSRIYDEMWAPSQTAAVPDSRAHGPGGGGNSADGSAVVRLRPIACKLKHDTLRKQLNQAVCAVHPAVRLLFASAVEAQGLALPRPDVVDGSCSGAGHEWPTRIVCFPLPSPMTSQLVARCEPALEADRRRSFDTRTPAWGAVTAFPIPTEPRSFLP